MTKNSTTALDINRFSEITSISFHNFKLYKSPVTDFHLKAGHLWGKRSVSNTLVESKRIQTRLRTGTNLQLSWFSNIGLSQQAYSNNGLIGSCKESCNLEKKLTRSKSVPSKALAESVVQAELQLKLRNVCSGPAHIFSKRRVAGWTAGTGALAQKLVFPGFPGDHCRGRLRAAAAAD